MQGLSIALVRRSALYLTLLVPFVALAFWPGYFSRLADQPTVRMHVHGVAMSAWLLLLVSQAWLIRGGRRPWHRLLGRASYVLFPLAVYSTLSLANWRLRQTTPIPADVLYFFYVQLALLVMFAAAFAGAIAHRREPRRHSRYMLCTALPLLDPVFARILYIHFGVDFPLSQVLTYLLMDGILLYLAVIDWREQTGTHVFAGMLALFVLLQAPTFVVSTAPGWAAFAEWYATLPI